MAENNKTPDEFKSSLFQKIGYIFILLLIIYSIIHVVIKSRPRVFFPGYKVLTIGHWLLEEGVRDGIDFLAKEFEKKKAQEGLKVKVVQSTIPIRGYKQWFTTQLIGQNPADLMAIHATISSPMLNKYFVPLSPYISKPNKYNKGTSLENKSWQDSVLGGMLRSLDPVFADYYGVASYWNVYRLYINLDLLELSTGNRNVPQDLNEWIDDCKKIKKYSHRNKGKEIIPIGTQGTDKKTLIFFMKEYFSQLTGNYNDQSLHGKVLASTLLQLCIDNPHDRNRILTICELMQELGQYFSKGFTAMDREQALFLFYSGKCAFFYGGNWEIGAMLKETPFKVGIARLPNIKKGTKYSRYYTGPLSESGVRAPKGFGITKAGKNFDLALDFLQFMTSHEMNQKWLSFSKWLPIVKNAEFKGDLQYFKPLLEGNWDVPVPFDTLLGRNGNLASKRKWLEDFENIIMEKIGNPKEYFWNNFKKRKNILLNEINESIISYYRSLLNIEKERSRIAVGLFRKDLSDQEINSLQLRKTISEEATVASTSDGKIGQYLKIKKYKEQVNRL